MSAYSNMKNENERYEREPDVGYAENPGYGWKPQQAETPSSAVGGGGGPSGTQPPPLYVDPESLQPKNMGFSEQSIRKGFIRKVYMILMGQLLFTFGMVALFLFHRPLQEYCQKNILLLVIALITTFVIVISMACCDSARRTYPTNFICLGIFTLAESFLVGVIAGSYNADVVILAIGITALLCLTLSLFAWQTKYDFTAWGGFLLSAIVCLFIFGIVGIFWQNHIVNTIYAGCGALLACIFLIYDTQIMMGGEHKYSISPEEYIFAALNLYMDVIRIFLFILQLLGSRRS